MIYEYDIMRATRLPDSPCPNPPPVSNITSLFSHNHEIMRFFLFLISQLTPHWKLGCLSCTTCLEFLCEVREADLVGLWLSYPVAQLTFHSSNFSIKLIS